jgi:hypothetical protein
VCPIRLRATSVGLKEKSGQHLYGIQNKEGMHVKSLSGASLIQAPVLRTNVSKDCFSPAGTPYDIEEFSDQ